MATRLLKAGGALPAAHVPAVWFSTLEAADGGEFAALVRVHATGVPLPEAGRSGLPPMGWRWVAPAVERLLGPFPAHAPLAAPPATGAGRGWRPRRPGLAPPLPFLEGTHYHYFQEELGCWPLCTGPAAPPEPVGPVPGARVRARPS